MEISEKRILIFQVTPVIDITMKELCQQSYNDHPNGCPNYGKKDTCPPKTKMFYEIFDVDYPVFAIVSFFDLKSHVEKMKIKHPMWSERQLASSRFWQGKVRKDLRGEINKFLEAHKDYGVTNCPEGLGVDVTETLKSADIYLEWPPRDVVCQVALAAKECNFDKESYIE